jgi:hypothetical protein
MRRNCSSGSHSFPTTLPSVHAAKIPLRRREQPHRARERRLQNRRRLKIPDRRVLRLRHLPLERLVALLDFRDERPGLVVGRAGLGRDAAAFLVVEPTDEPDFFSNCSAGSDAKEKTASFWRPSVAIMALTELPVAQPRLADGPHPSPRWTPPKSADATARSGRPAPVRPSQRKTAAA